MTAEETSQGPSTSTPALSEALLFMLTAAHSPGCSISAKKPSKQTRSHRQALSASVPETGTVYPACTSLLHMRSPLHINHCRFCMCSPRAPWENAFGKYSSIIEKVLKCGYENSCLFLFALQCYLYSSSTRQKASTGIAPLQEKDQEE